MLQCGKTVLNMQKIRKNMPNMQKYAKNMKKIDPICKKHANNNAKKIC